MRVLVACEESQAVMSAFRANGHDAFSCDIKMCSGDYPAFHLLCDVREILHYGWDLMIGHPPCTFLTRAGSCCFYRDGERVEERFERQREAKEFFMVLWNAPIHRICLENPVPMASAALPPWSQVIYPELFGAEYTKQTCLWLKNLPPLIPKFSGLDYVAESLCAVKRSAAERSKTPPAVAQAMAEQWNF